MKKKVVTDEPVSADIVALLDGCTSTFQMLAEQEEGPTDAASKPAAAASSMGATDPHSVSASAYIRRGRRRRRRRRGELALRSAGAASPANPPNDPIEELAYWDLAAALASPADLTPWMPIITAPGRGDLDIHTVTSRRDDFIIGALRRADR